MVRCVSVSLREEAERRDPEKDSTVTRNKQDQISEGGIRVQSDVFLVMVEDEDMRRHFLLR
jgi:hypothetical protein